MALFKKKKKKHSVESVLDACARFFTFFFYKNLGSEKKKNPRGNRRSTSVALLYFTLAQNLNSAYPAGCPFMCRWRGSLQRFPLSFLQSSCAVCFKRVSSKALPHRRSSCAITPPLLKAPRLLRELISV